MFVQPEIQHPVRRWCRALALGTALALLAPAAPEATRTGASVLVLGPDGHLYSWTAGEPALEPLPATLARIDRGTVNDLAASEDGRSFLVLPAAPPAGAAGGKGGKRARAEGLAILVASGDGPLPPRIVKEIHFDGEGRRAVLSRDGKRAFVLSIRATRTWIHELDLESGRVIASGHIDQPPAALTLDPAGTRLYLAYTGRIVSYTARPLALSWHYRSPGANRGIYFRPGSAVLFAVRQDQVTLFDPGTIAARPPEDRRRQEDEATAVIPVPFAAESLIFSSGGRLAAVHGDGNGLAFIDLETGRALPLEDGVVLFGEIQEIRPIGFDDGGGDLLVATFPDRRVIAVPAPTPPPAPTPKPFPSPSPTPAPFPSPAPTPTPPLPGPPPPEPPPPVPDPSPPPPMPTPTPPPPMPPPTPGAGPGLSGRITGRTDLVQVVLIFGPDSIIREQARIAPEADGTWRAPLPPPGTYRVVPVGAGARPLRSEPHFQTVQVRDGGREDLDFRILGTD